MLYSGSASANAWTMSLELNQAFFASVDFEHCYSFVAGEDCFNDVSLLADIRIW